MAGHLARFEKYTKELKGQQSADKRELAYHSRRGHMRRMQSDLNICAVDQ